MKNITKMEINKAEAIVELQKLKEQIEVLEGVINTPDKPSAKEWLEDFMKQEFTVKFTNGFITYYLSEGWIFQLDIKYERYWCYYYKVWQYLVIEYHMNYADIQLLVKDVVGTALNCKGFTPNQRSRYYVQP